MRRSEGKPVFEALETRVLLSVTAGIESVANELMTPALAYSATPNVTNTTPTGLTPAQVAKAYGFDTVTFTGAWGTVKGDGTGQTIAIVDAYDDPNVLADLKVFDAQFGLSNNDGLGNLALTVHKMATNVKADAGWALEIALDVEWAHAVAPGAHILLVEAATSYTTDLLSAVDYARSQTGVVAVSMSWGGSEFSGEKGYDSYFTTPAGHVGGSGLAGGVTFTTASGDNGAGAEWPAVSPNVVTVGGTTLKVDASGNWLSETGWTYSGGGISRYEGKPNYQAGVTQSSQYRTSPDVAYDADTNTGFAVYDSVTYSRQSGWFQVGGTSAGAPQWAGLVAIADQGRALNGKGSLDGTQQTLPTLYKVAEGAYHDILTGRNGSSRSGYSAGTGYDLVTGVGTPRAGMVIADLMAVTTMTPLTQVTVGGSGGGGGTGGGGGRHGRWAEIAESATTQVATTSETETTLGTVEVKGMAPGTGPVWTVRETRVATVSAGQMSEHARSAQVEETAGEDLLANAMAGFELVL